MMSGRAVPFREFPFILRRLCLRFSYRRHSLFCYWDLVRKGKPFRSSWRQAARL